MGSRRASSAPTEARAARSRVLDALRRIVRALRVSSHSAEGALGISGAQLFVLQQLAQRPAESLRDIATRTLTDQSSVSVVVARLVRNGLVARRASTSDARQIQLTITLRGRKLLARAPALAHTRLLTALQALPASEVVRLARTLATLASAMGVAGHPAAMFFESDPRPVGPRQPKTTREE